jgi:hypothetical protein
VVTAEQENGEWEYLIHYQGWNKKWDEWLPGDRLIKDTAAARYAEVWTCVPSPPRALLLTLACLSPPPTVSHRVCCVRKTLPASPCLPLSYLTLPYLTCRLRQRQRVATICPGPVREASVRTVSEGVTGMEGGRHAPAGVATSAEEAHVPESWVRCA